MIPSYSPEQMDLLRSIFLIFRNKISSIQRVLWHKTNKYSDGYMLHVLKDIEKLFPNPLPSSTFSYICSIIKDEVR